MPPALAFEPPIAVALFPTYAVLCWEHPRTSVTRAFAEHSTWDYRVEYTCACRMRHQPYAMSTAETCAIVATPHPGEMYYVRVVARATLAGSTAGIVSSKMSFAANSTMVMPWASPEHALSPLIFDGLYLCAANAWESSAAALSDSRRTPAEHGCTLNRAAPLCVLDSDVECRLYHATYDRAASPVNTRTVLYMVATGRRTRSGQRMRSRDIESLLQRESAALVFCGVEDSGRLAVKAAHALLSSFTTSCPALGRSVFCVTYGTPRLLLRDGRQLLVHTLPRSYHFLHVTQLPLSDGSSSLVEDAAVVSQRYTGSASTLRLTGYSEGFYPNALLGVQCRLMLSRRGTSEELHFQPSSPALPPTAAEESEIFDVAFTLQRLARLFFPSSPSWLAPTITSAAFQTNGPLFHLTLQGTGLQYSPRLTVLPQQHVPAFPRVRDSGPHRLTCIGSLLPWLEECAQAGSHCAGADAKRGLDAPLCVLVQTCFGTCVHSLDAGVTLPMDLVELYQSAAAMTTPWATATFADLLERTLQTQPLYTICQSTTVAPAPSSSTAGPANVQLNPLADLLCSVASAAEAALMEKMAVSSTAVRATGSVLGFMGDVAARFSAAVSNASAATTAKLAVPRKEAAFLTNALREWASSRSPDIDVWRQRSASWKQRALHGLPLLSDTLYRRTLVRMLRVFDPEVDANESVPHLWLEARLYTHVRLHVSLRQSFGVNMDECFSSAVTLSDFYTAMVDVFTSAPHTGAAATPATSLPWVEEVMVIWVLCQCFELRREVSNTLFCCTVGCAGCGASTLAAALSSLWFSAEAVAHSPTSRHRRVPTCRVTSSRLPALCMAMQSSVRIGVFIAGEVADLTRPEYASMCMQIQENICAGQHWFRVITKADEHLQRTRKLKAASSTPEYSAEFLIEAEKEVLGSNFAEERSLMVSLAPSPLLLAQAFQCCAKDAAAFASALRAISRRALLRCLLLSIQQTDASALT